ncbi:MAG: sialidase family protein, partial [Planctomycetaceae bacterium]
QSKNDTFHPHSGACPMKIEYQAVVYHGSRHGADGQIAFFDSSRRLSSGTWMSGYTTGKVKHHRQATIRLSRSRDDANSWETLPWKFRTDIDGVPGSLAGAEIVEPAPGRLLLFSTWFDRSEPDRPLFDPDTEGILRSRQLICESADEGSTWSDWREIPTPGLKGCAMTGPVVQWSDGVIGFAFESFKEFDDPTPVEPAAWLLLSEDGGATFDRRFQVAQDPDSRLYYWDQRICPGKTAGDFLALFWVHDRSAQRDLRVHLLRSSITTGDRPTVQPTETTIPGQIAAPLLLDEDRILAFVVDRDRPGTLTLWQSPDDGVTWPEQDALTLHVHDEQARLSQGSGKDNVDFAQFWEDMGRWSFGHPTLKSAGPDRVLATWYAGTPDCMDVHSAMIDVS